MYNETHLMRLSESRSALMRGNVHLSSHHCGLLAYTERLCCKHILFLEGSSDNRKGLQFSLLAKRGHLELSDCCLGAPDKARLSRSFPTFREKAQLNRSWSWRGVEIFFGLFKLKIGVHICMCGPNISKFLFLFFADLLRSNILMLRGTEVLTDKVNPFARTLLKCGLFGHLTERPHQRPSRLSVENLYCLRSVDSGSS